MKSGNWTVIFEDKKIIKKTGVEAGTAYDIEDNSFWNDSKWGNVWAIQFTNDNTDNDQVEHRDATPHSFYDVSIYGDFSQFITKWDSAHLNKLQSNWDQDTLVKEDGSPETDPEKITRLGVRPTTYNS